jgi:hypothetical protein
MIMPSGSMSQSIIGMSVVEPPDNWVLGRVAESLLLFRDDRRAVVVDAFGASPGGFTFRATFTSREPLDRYEQGPLHPTRSDALTVRYADGTDSSGNPAGVRLFPRGGSGTSTVWHQDWWCTPLPPPGPVEFEVAIPGQEAKASIDASLLRDAAERAFQLWPDQELDAPVIDPRNAPALPPAGPSPADPETARQQIRAAYTAGLVNSDPSFDPMSAIQDGPALEGARLQARANHPGPAATIRIGLGEIVFIDEVRAALHFQLNWSGAMTFGPQLGYAVLEGGRWRVARNTYCQVLGWAGVSCPPPPPERPTT